MQEVVVEEVLEDDRHPADPVEVADALKGALLTDDEMDRPHGWNRYHDPFGDWHEDPCYETPDMAGEFSAHRNSDGEAR